MSRNHDRTNLMVMLALLLPVAALAAPPLQPGVYEGWDGEIDRLEIVESFTTRDYRELLLAPLETADTALPDADDNTYEPVLRVLADVDSALRVGIDDAAPDRLERIGAADGLAPREGSLLLRGRVVACDPGSQAARYWAGFGAGAARVTLELELLDAASERVLLRIRQERVSSGTFAFTGGNYEKLLRKNLRTIGEDVGDILTAFE